MFFLLGCSPDYCFNVNVQIAVRLSLLSVLRGPRGSQQHQSIAAVAESHHLPPYKIVLARSRHHNEREDRFGELEVFMLLLFSSEV